MTARQIIEKRLGYSIGPIKTMPKDLRVAMKGLAIMLIKVRAQQ